MKILEIIGMLFFDKQSLHVRTCLCTITRIFSSNHYLTHVNVKRVMYCDSLAVYVHIFSFFIFNALGLSGVFHAVLIIPVVRQEDKTGFSLTVRFYVSDLRQRLPWPNASTNWKNNSSSSNRPPTSSRTSIRKRSTKWRTIRWGPYRSEPCCRFTRDTSPVRRGGPSPSCRRRPGHRRYLHARDCPLPCPDGRPFPPSTTRRPLGTTWVIHQPRTSLIHGLHVRPPLF